MIDSLYDRFKEWSDSGSVYIISDTHFEDADCEYMDANWLPPQEHIDKINKTVHVTDTLVILGDVGNVEWIRKLKAGKKILITGNHDAGVENYKRTVEKRVFDKDDFPDWKFKDYVEAFYKDEKARGFSIKYREEYEFARPFASMNIYADNKLFDEVYDGPLFISDRILLSHEPIIGMEKFCINIHGHDHAGTKLPNHINVASNVTGFEVFNLGKFIKNGGLSKVTNYHRATIDKATERKKKRQ